MRRALFLLGLAVLLPVLVAGTAIAHLLVNRVTTPDTFHELGARLDAQIPSLMEKQHVPGVAIALIDHGDVAVVRGYGFADTTRHTPVGDETVFQAGSLSKPVTAWGVMHLVEVGEVELDAPVSEYLTRWQFPDSRYDESGVTVRRLLSHTAGVSVSGYLGYDPDQALPSLETQLETGPDAADGDGEVRVAYPPGETDHYSGGGYTILQLLIEEVSGESFATYMQQNVLDPLGMTDSTFEPTSAVISGAATPYAPDGDALPHYRFVSKAAGGLYTTASDLGRFVVATLSGPSQKPARGVLSPHTIDEMLSPAPGATSRLGPLTVYSLGLGYHLDEVLLGSDARVVGHDGSNRGWKSSFLAVPAEGSGIAILTNSETGGPLNDAVSCIWVRWATHGTIPPCLETQTNQDLAVGAVIWLAVLAAILGRRIVRARRTSCSTSAAAHEGRR